jgi:CheY-like chemotaxis protein
MNSAPHVLVVEDDTSSRFFLREALRNLNIKVCDVSFASEALKMAAQQPFDAWLIDANLPEMSAEELLPQLRDFSSAERAIAMSAMLPDERKQSLQAAGFDLVIEKPITLRMLERALELDKHISPGDKHALQSMQSLPRWDKQQAMNVLAGNEQAWRQLQGLFYTDLAQQRQQIKHAIDTDDLQRADSVLHQLQSSCRLLGAERLLAHVNRLKQMPQSLHTLQAFMSESDDMLRKINLASEQG